jgi:hypothetical protein
MALLDTHHATNRVSAAAAVGLPLERSMMIPPFISFIAQTAQGAHLLSVAQGSLPIPRFNRQMSL